MSKKPRLGNSWQRWLAFGFGSGLSPVGPGTLGTMVAVPIVVMLDWLPTLLTIIVVVLFILLAAWITGAVSKEMDQEDHPAIVIDEMAGYLVTMLLVPVTGWTLLAGFLLFRLFDIWKPQPIAWLDREVSGGLGITIDDVVAGVYANLVLQLLLLFFGY